MDTLALSLGLVLTIFGYAVVQAATARALVEMDAGRPVTALGAYRLIAPRLGGLRWPFSRWCPCSWCST